MRAGHQHAIPEGSNERSLWIALALTTTFLVAEVIGGIVTKSLALISDAAHMATDVAALAVALAAIRLAKRPSDLRRTFGYHRFEILAAAFNAVLLFLVAIYILYEAYRRFEAPPEIQSLGMLLIASIGLVVNLVSMRLLAGGKDSSLNVKGAYLEVWSDMLGSIGVILGALVIRFTGWAWVDSVVAVGIGLWVLPRTWLLLKESLNILLEGVPEGIDLAAVQQSIRTTPGVRDVHDLHVWAITSGKTSLTAHIVLDQDADDSEVVSLRVREVLGAQFRIFHTTLQAERSACSQAEEGCAYAADAQERGHVHAAERHVH